MKNSEKKFHDTKVPNNSERLEDTLGIKKEADATYRYKEDFNYNDGELLQSDLLQLSENYLESPEKE
jgi:hypothetical protein